MNGHLSLWSRKFSETWDAEFNKLSKKQQEKILRNNKSSHEFGLKIGKMVSHYREMNPNYDKE